MSIKIKNLVKIESFDWIEFIGKLEQSGDYYDSIIEEVGYTWSVDGEELNTWFQKLEGQQIKVTIEVLKDEEAS